MRGSEIRSQPAEAKIGWLVNSQSRSRDFPNCRECQVELIWADCFSELLCPGIRPPQPKRTMAATISDLDSYAGNEPHQHDVMVHIEALDTNMTRIPPNLMFRLRLVPGRAVRPQHSRQLYYPPVCQRRARYCHFTLKSFFQYRKPQQAASRSGEYSFEKRSRSWMCSMLTKEDLYLGAFHSIGHNTLQ